MQPDLFPLTRSEKIQIKLKKYGLPISLRESIEDFLSGKRNVESLICCHSECFVCNETLYQCVSELKLEL